MLNINFDSPLSRYPIALNNIRLEYQIGQILVWVHFPNSMSEADALAVASDLLNSVWNDSSQALAIAEGVSRSKVPEFWSVHDASELPGERLKIWSLQINVADCSAEYHVSENPSFFARLQQIPGERSPPVLPDFPASHILTVARTAEGILIAGA